MTFLEEHISSDSVKILDSKKYSISGIDRTNNCERVKQLSFILPVWLTQDHILL